MSRTITHPRRLTVPLKRLHSSTLVEAHEATMRLLAETAALKRQLAATQFAADSAAERAGEGRLLPEGRTNPHGE